MMKREKNRDRVTRERLRQMEIGETLTVMCINGNDLYAQKSSAYAMQKIDNCVYSCKAEGLKLSVTKSKE